MTIDAAPVIETERLRLERWDESERLFRRALELLESMGSHASAMMSCIYHLTMVLHARGEHTQADVLYCKALALAERHRAFPRALRLPGPLDAEALRQHVITENLGRNKR